MKRIIVAFSVVLTVHCAVVAEPSVNGSFAIVNKSVGTEIGSMFILTHDVVPVSAEWIGGTSHDLSAESNWRCRDSNDEILQNVLPRKGITDVTVSGNISFAVPSSESACWKTIKFENATLTVGGDWSGTFSGDIASGSVLDLNGNSITVQTNSIFLAETVTNGTVKIDVSDCEITDVPLKIMNLTVKPVALNYSVLPESTACVFSCSNALYVVDAWVPPDYMEEEDPDARCGAALRANGFSDSVAEKLSKTFLYSSFVGWAKNRDHSPFDLRCKDGVILAASYNAPDVPAPEDVKLTIENFEVGDTFRFNIRIDGTRAGFDPAAVSSDLLNAALDIECTEVLADGFSKEGFTYEFGSLIEQTVFVTVRLDDVHDSYFIRVRAE